MEKLWTKDFTIITIGSVVSLIGNSMVGFAMSLFVLDYKASTIYYAIYIFLYTLPQIAAPIIAGPLIDRFSRRKTIYYLDFVSTGLYLGLIGLITFEIFSFPIFAAGVFVAGIINSVYQVAFESFYPMLISEGNYSKAYSIASTLENFAFFMMPLAAFVYKTVGLIPILIFSVVTFLAAAICETRISDVEADEKYLVNVHEYKGSAYLQDMKEGWKYLRGEKGLLAIATYFVLSTMVSGADQIIWLPYFKTTFANGEYIFLTVTVFIVIGRMLGGVFHYKIKLPTERKFNIALGVYISIAILEGTCLFLPVMGMRISLLLAGLLGVTSYNIRISATQAYVPNEKKGRFNGIFIMLMTGGALIGEGLSGVVAEFIDMRLVLLGFNIIAGLGAILIIGGNKRHVAEIYNRQS